MKRVMIICLLFPGLVLAEGPEFAKKTIDLKLQKYEEKLVACERVESNRYSPGDDALDVLIQRAQPFSSGCALSN
ncbi:MULTISPECIES: hypothetical protein [Marinobacter]|uniref:Secreted protein n=1 Tax=Marinobacter shengliensis TaxID=1389223 RepID=A0ABV4WB94_9GAMM|nr:hypothetical protein [Marinobacter sp.]MAO11920.1 hypothetical protein [Marinobacter sp.]